MLLSGFDGNRRFKPGKPTDQPVPDYTDCSGSSETNKDYTSQGYDYSITIAPHTTGATKIQIYDPGFDPWCWHTDWFASFPNDAGFPSDDSCDPSVKPPSLDTTYSLYDTMETDSHLDDQLVKQQTWGYSTTDSSIDSWVTLANVPANPGNQPRTYRLNVTTAKEANSFGVNAFSIAAVPAGGSVKYCDIRKTSTCPEVSGDGAMSVNADSVSNSGYDTFWLAEVDPSYAGDTLQVTLWDPGEGYDDLKLIAPDGSIVPVRWSASPAVSGTPTGAVYSVDTSNDGPTCHDAPWADWETVCDQPGTNRYSSAKLNDRAVVLTAQIPPDYQSYINRASGSTWWSVQYEAGQTWGLHDRTTWLVSIGGQEPVHLVPTS